MKLPTLGANLPYTCGRFMKFHIMLAGLACIIASSASAQQEAKLRPYNEPVTHKEFPEVRPQDSAPPLTSVSVYAVGSTQYGGWEKVAGKQQTDGDHGGSQLRVAVVEWGYATYSSRNATYNGSLVYNGSTLRSDARYNEEPICGGSPSEPQPCGRGDTVVGYIEYYALDGLANSGQFTYSATSMISPTRTYRTQFYIN